jgi:hypothetical protein
MLKKTNNVKLLLIFLCILIISISSCSALKKQGTITSQPIIIETIDKANITPSEGGVIGSANLSTAIESLLKVQLEKAKNENNQGIITGGAGWVATVSAVILIGIIVMFVIYSRLQTRELMGVVNMIIDQYPLLLNNKTCRKYSAKKVSKIAKKK